MGSEMCIRDSRVASTICGVSKASRIEQTLSWAQWEIPDALWEEVAQVSVSAEDPEASREYKPG